MAFQVNGTNVLNDSAELVNIVDASNFARTVTKDHAAGAVGSYAFAGSGGNTMGAITQGATRAGSSLIPGCVTGSNGNTAPSLINYELIHWRVSTLSGTWVATANNDTPNTVDNDGYITVWFRRV